MACTKTTQQKATEPRGVPQHKLAPRHEGSSSGSNDPIGDLEVKVERLTSELCHGNRERARDSCRIAELSEEVDHLQREIVERDRARLGRKFTLYSLGLRGECLSPGGGAKHSPGESASVQ